MTGTDRLFVPLTIQAFGYWTKGKTHELRLDSPRWSPEHVRCGRLVELRRGYSGPALWGIVGAVHRGSLRELSELPSLGVSCIIPGAVWWREVLPAIGLRTRNWRAVWGRAAVAFEVLLDTPRVEARGKRPGSTCEACDGCIKPRRVEVIPDHSSIRSICWCDDGQPRDARRCPRIRVTEEQTR